MPVQGSGVCNGVQFDHERFLHFVLEADARRGVMCKTCSWPAGLKRAVSGIEPEISCTLNRHHTTRPYHLGHLAVPILCTLGIALSVCNSISVGNRDAR
jgi:hypothetical protein